ncbi:MAG: hypothetical protein KC994_08075, partial [Candidatus Omnitrophica bacterium]|nr:hypothetical protein [Candidatus Omnitrophota bacterium]
LAGQMNPILDNSLTTRDQTYRCRVTPFDGIDIGPAMNASVIVQNTPPTGLEFDLLPEIPTPDDGLAVLITQESIDVDDDLIVYLFEWFDSPDGIVWHRRPELSGNLNPFFPGEPEVSDLLLRLIQAAEYWRVDVTPIEVPPGLAKGQIVGSTGNWVVGPTQSRQKIILPDLDGDNSVGSEDLLFIESRWGKSKQSLSENDRDLLFSESSSATDEIGIRHLFNLVLTWYEDSNPD